MSARIQALNSVPDKPGKSVVYVMSRDQRVHDNFALLEAQQYALDRKLPLIVFFNLFTQLSVRCLQQHMFMVAGMQKVETELTKFSIPLIVKVGNVIENIEYLGKNFEPAALFFDFSPLRTALQQKKDISEKISVPCFVVDTHNIVPIWTASEKEEWAAYTFRPKINRLLPEYLLQIQKLERHPYIFDQLPNHNWQELISHIKAPVLKGYAITFKSGEDAANAVLDTFLTEKLEYYGDKRNNPSEDYQSNLSPYLHFGQISSLTVALATHDYMQQHSHNIAIKTSAEAFLEELIVRKELADNFCFYNQNYDNYDGIKDWAKKSLEAHAPDKREFLYDREELEDAHTHDSAWNAAQIQLTRTGKMHGYMRMYWAKKLLEWTPQPKTAIEYGVYLNDKYHLDGYDPNGYVGILWSIGGIHDRPWFDRPIFGQIRYMNYNGLKKKFDIQRYIDKWK